MECQSSRKMVKLILDFDQHARSAVDYEKGRKCGCRMPFPSEGKTLDRFWQHLFYRGEWSDDFDCQRWWFTLSSFSSTPLFSLGSRSECLLAGNKTYVILQM